MKLFPKAITRRVASGYVQGFLRLHPDDIMGKGGWYQGTRNCPDNWFMRVRWVEERMVLTPMDSKAGDVYLTRTGFNANRTAIQKAYRSACKAGNDRTDGKGWKAFEEEAERTWKAVAEGTRRTSLAMRVRATQAESLLEQTAL